MADSNLGKKFERNFKESALRQELFFLRLNDSDLSFGGVKGSRFTPTNPCDFIGFLDGKLFMLELKSTCYKSIPIQRNPEEEKKMIKAHQISDLSKYSLYEGIYSGFVFNFRDDDCIQNEDTYYMSIEDFNNFLYETDKKSINKLDIIEHGGFKINQILRRTNYAYDVKNMFKEIIKIKTGMMDF